MCFTTPTIILLWAAVALTQISAYSAHENLTARKIIEAMRTAYAKKSKRSLIELVNVIAWDTECELVCKLAKLSALRRDSVSRSSRGCVTERNCLPSNMSHVLARVRDVLIEFTVNTNLPFRTAKSFQLLEIWTNPTIREAAFRSPGE